MTQVQVDQALQQKLFGLAEPLELCDSEGRVLGHFLPESDYKKMLYGSVEVPYSDEEISRRRAQKGGSTLREIWDRVGQK